MKYSVKRVFQVWRWGEQSKVKTEKVELGCKENVG